MIRVTLITKKFGREIFGRFFSKFRTKFRTKSQIVISKNLQNLGRKCGNEALKRIKMNELGRLLVVEIVKSKFHKIKKKKNKKKDLVVKNLQIVNAKYILFSFSL